MSSPARSERQDAMPMMKPVQILHLEDEPADTELVHHALKKSGLDCRLHRVADRDGFVAALDRGGFDLILADYNLPSFDGLNALAAAHALRPEVPFLFLSGFLGEEVAIESLRQGATDYVFKHNLKRLGSAVVRALQEFRQRREQAGAEAALQTSEAALRSFFDTAPFMMGVVELLDDDIRHLSANSTTALFRGTTPEAMLGCCCSEMGVSRDIVDTWLTHFRQASRSSRPVRFEYQHPRGDRVHHLSVTVSPLPEVAGQIRRFCYVAEDSTDRKLLEQQFLRAQRLESIGTLTGGIAHDLNNVLAPFRVSLRVFQNKLTAPEDRELLDSLDVSARRGEEIIRKMLTFARGAEGARHPVQLKDLVRDLETMIRETFPRSIEVATEVAEDLWTVQGDTTQIYQVLLNLCLNARDAMPQGGRLLLRAANVAYGATGSGQHVTLTVADTGTGMPEAVRARVFEPFFTTKEIGKGTGLGLSTAQTIVRSHGGSIRVASEPGMGSEFMVQLPAEPCASHTEALLSRATPPRGCGELILVVDDEATIRQAVKGALLGHGYDVVTANCGREALAVLAEHGDRVRLVITDLVMPGMDAWAFVRELRSISPQMNLIVVSGVLETQPIPSGAEWSEAVFLPKPIVPEVLLHHIHILLSREGSDRSPAAEIACAEQAKLGIPEP
jgi:PAS domain S-box-containing protein